MQHSRDLETGKITVPPVMTMTTREVDAQSREKGLTGRDERVEQFSLATPDEISRMFSRANPQKRQLIIHAALSPYIIQSVEQYRKDVGHRIFLTPQGKPFDPPDVQPLSLKGN